MVIPSRRINPTLRPAIIAGSVKSKITLGETQKSKRFNQIRQEQTTRIRNRVIKALAIVIAGYLVYFFFFSSFFRLEYVIITGNNQISSQEIEPIVWQALAKSKLLLLPGDNYFLASTNDVSKELGKNFVFNNLKVTKKLPKTIAITVEEKSPRFIWFSQDKHYLMTGDGLIIREFSAYQDQDVIPLITDESNATTTINEVVANNQILSLIGNTKELLDAQPIPNLKITSFNLADRGSRFIKLITQEGAEIHLGQEMDLNQQLIKLRKIIESNHLELSKVQYINLRIPEQAIYKLK